VATKTSADREAELPPEEPESREEQEDKPESDAKEPGGDLQRHFDELEDLIRENPLVAVAAAAGVGLVVGLLLSRR